MSKFNKNDIRFSFSYPETMKEELIKLARKGNRTLSSYVKLVLDNHVKKLINNKRG